MRYRQYKAHWTTGGATDCGGVASPVRAHAPPPLFDLSADPAEASALDVGVPKYAAIVAAMSALRARALAAIASSLRSVANYESGPAGAAVNCCNATHVACRCEN